MFEIDLVVHDPGGPQFWRLLHSDWDAVHATLARLGRADTAFLGVEPLHGAPHAARATALWLWLSPSGAHLRVDEHREHFALRPASLPSVAAEGVTFRDEDGSAFTVLGAEVLDRRTAMTAVLHWLQTGARTSALAWT